MWFFSVNARKLEKMQSYDILRDVGKKLFEQRYRQRQFFQEQLQRKAEAAARQSWRKQLVGCDIKRNVATEQAI